MTWTLFIISSFVLLRIKPVIWVWNETRVSKWWKIFHFERTNPLKSCPLPAAITYVEQNHQLKPCINLAMTFLFSMVSVMVIDLGQIKQFYFSSKWSQSAISSFDISQFGHVKVKCLRHDTSFHFNTFWHECWCKSVFLSSLPPCTASITETKPLSIVPVLGHPSVLQCCWCLLNSWGRWREVKVGVCHIFPGQLPSSAHTFMNADRSEEIPLKITFRSWPFDFICKFWIPLH